MPGGNAGYEELAGGLKPIRTVKYFVWIIILFFNRWSERRHICSCDRICRCPTSQYDGYVPLVLLEHFSHGFGWIGLSHKRLENAKYCHVGSWNSRIAWLVVSVEAIHKSYKDFRLVTCFFFFTLLLIFLYVDSLTPESVRWLMIKGKTEQAKEIFRKIAKVNKMPMSDMDLKPPEDDQRLGDVRELFATRKMVQKTLLSWYCW